MAALPDWKLQLLERKKKEEEEGRRRDMELQERLSKMPAWKREIIERRRAKLSSGTSFSEAGEGVGGFPQHGGSFQGPWPGPAVVDGETVHAKGWAEEDKSTVLQEKIGPVHQNPFIKLEKQRKESADGDTGSKARNMADLYSQLPGVRTIRADNIIIIESDPRFFQLDDHREESKSKSVEALNSMISGSNPREIHANEVLIIKSSLSRSVEDLNSINRGQEESSTPGRPRKGQVSQLLSKFGQEKGTWTKAARSLSTENLGEKASRVSYEEDAFSPEPGHGCPLTISKLEANWQNKVNYDTRTSPTSSLPSPTTSRTRSPSDSRRSPLPTSPDEARGHLPSPNQSLPPQHKVAPFRGQMKTKSLEVPSPESPCRSPSSPSSLTPKLWQKDHPRHLEVAEEPRQNMGPVQLAKDRPAPIGETVLLSSATSTRASTRGVPRADISLSGTEDEDGLTPGVNCYIAARVDPSSSNRLDTCVGHQKNEDISEAPSRNTCKRVGQDSEARGASDCTGPGPPSPSVTAMPNLQHGVLGSTSLNNTFEIRPAAMPDFSLIPQDDVQGLALANLRLQSKNSFVIVPRRRPSPPPDLKPSPGAEQEASTLPPPKPPALCLASSPGEALPAQPEPTAASCSETPGPAAGRAPLGRNVPGFEQQQLDAWPLTAPGPLQQPEDAEFQAEQTEEEEEEADIMSRLPKPALPPKKPNLGRPEDGRPPPFSVRKPGACFYQPERTTTPRPVPPTAARVAQDTGSGRDLRSEETVQPTRGGPPLGAQIPTTNTPTPEPRVTAAHPAVQRRSGNTITINPRKSPAGPPVVENGDPAVPMDTDAPTRTEGPRANPGKKRYPTAEEIQVIGGYLALERSCLSKSDPQRRRMEISFSESDLERIFEYPSEDSLIEEFGPPEELDAPPPNTQADDDDEEESILPQNGLSGSRSVGNIMRTKPLIVDESCRR